MMVMMWAPRRLEEPIARRFPGSTREDLQLGMRREIRAHELLCNGVLRRKAECRFSTSEYGSGRSEDIS
jgi:hypothetical protein